MSKISIPGFSSVTDSRLSTVRRIQWAAAMGLCFALCVYQTRDRIETYFNYPTIMSNEYQSQEQSPILFPLVTLCPIEAFNNRALYDLRMENIRTDGTIPSVYDLINVEGIDVDHIWNLSGFNYNSYINTCIYSSRENCGHSVFWKEKYTILGKCNTLYIKNSTWYHGSYYGIVLNITDMWCDITQVLPDIRFYGMQFRILLHDEDDDVTYTIGYKGGYIFQKTTSTVSYAQTTFVGLNSPKRPCNAKKYVTECLQRCYDKYVLQNITAKCRLPFMKYADRYPLCNTRDQLKPFLERIMHHGNNLRMSGCETKCGSSCSLNQFDSQFDANLRPQNINESFIYIHPSRNGVSIWREKDTYSIFQLFCDFGALFGIYMGISLLTLAEIGEYLVHILINRFNTKK